MDLSYFEMLKGARNIINVSAGIKKGEQLLIVTDTNKFEVAELIALAAQEKEINYSIAIMAVREPGEEPPKPIAAAMKRADIIIAPTTQSLYHNHATLAARDAGARFIAMSGILPEIMASPATRFNFQSFQPVVNKVAEVYRKAERIKVTSPSGTNIEALIKGRRVNVDGGLCHEPGQAIGIPIMEVNTAPIENTTNGKIVIDTSMSFLGILKEKIILTIQDGYIKKIEGGEEARRMKDILDSKDDPNVYIIAEIAIGLNPKAEIRGVLAEDEGVLGTMHFGIGNNLTLGGDNKASLHMDVIISRPTMLLDDVVLTKDGELQV